ncbi:MAG: peptidoglycan DD-metalloendopeptidase family protein [Gammaproteobacteria bacterium]|nr:peptidoglycan DD-metalloendopeptidase family protein [Gammaproteobacteria bacterium]
MDSFINFLDIFARVSIYSIAASALAYVIASILSRRLYWINQWKNFWLVVFVCCVATSFIELVPANQTNSNVNILNDFYFGPLFSSQSQATFSDISSSVFAQLDLASWLKFSWFLICVTGALYNLKLFIHQIVSVRQIVTASTNIKQFELNPFEFTQQSNMISSINRLARQKYVTILVSNKKISPFIVQWTEPTLVLTESAIQSLSSKELKLLIQHELTHLRRYDGLATLLTQFLLCIFWFNPFLRSIHHSLNWAIESSCDRQVLKNKKNLRRIYAQAMLKILRGSATEDANHAVAAFSPKTHRSITMRIKHIMKPSDVRVNSAIKAIGLSMFALSFSSMAYSFYPTDGKDTSRAGTNMENPVKQAKVSSNFGVKNKFHKFHKGIDLAAEMHSPVVAAGAGKVIIATTKLDKAKNYGTIIIIDHGNETHTVYSHLDSMNVVEGDLVKQGQLIGKVGVTGKTTGPHVHFEVRKGGEQVDPRDYIKFD